VRTVRGGAHGAVCPTACMIRDGLPDRAYTWGGRTGRVAGRGDERLPAAALAR